MSEKTKTLIKSIAIPLIIGATASLISGFRMVDFDVITKPPLYPPAWLFPVVWTILYLLMGISSYKVFVSDKPMNQVGDALVTYALQLAANFIWPILFFNFQWFTFAFLWLIFLWLLIFRTIQQFWTINNQAAYLLIPYIVWVTFAGYLNLAIAVLN